jgi:hypothetical protein
MLTATLQNRREARRWAYRDSEAPEWRTRAWQRRRLGLRLLWARLEMAACARV